MSLPILDTPRPDEFPAGFSAIPWPYPSGVMLVRDGEYVQAFADSWTALFVARRLAS